MCWNVHRTADLVRDGVITSRSKDVRVAAVSALRLVPGAEADAMILNALGTDENRQVRLAALRALQKREPVQQIVDAIARAARSDESERVRYEGVRMLARHLATTPAAAAALEQVSRSDKQPTIRAIAARALNGEEQERGDERTADAHL